jgi:ABC-type nitrate/sulfonate/bicarbonate transport system ATPase subunit
MNTVLESISVSKSYGGRRIIEDISIHVDKGEMVSLLGMSGIGKTTLFNILSGLEAPDEGKVLLKGEDVTGRAGKVGYMQQSDLLLPFKKIGANVAIPLILSGEKKKDALSAADKILDEFGLGEYTDMYPNQLSGGMRQRAALARTFLYAKDVLLLDEPFSALDAMTRRDMQTWFREKVKSHSLSTLFITHDINEAILLSDRIYIMSGEIGKITEETKINVPDGENAELTDEFISAKKKILNMVAG